MSIYSVYLEASIMEFLASIVSWFRNALPLDGAATWIQTKLPFLEESHTQIIVVGLVALIVWILVSFVKQSAKRNSGWFIVAGLVLAVSAFMGAIAW